MALPAPSPWLQESFDQARQDFKQSLKNPSKFDFTGLYTIDDVLAAADKIQKQQAKTRTLRALNRIRPLIEGIQEYDGVLSVFVQVKPEILALIWGPLKLILQISGSVVILFENVIKVLADIGLVLPSFNAYVTLFESNGDVRNALVLFYKDILDFYAVVLNFLSGRAPVLSVISEAVWPRVREEISKIQQNIDHHKLMMTTHVTLEQIKRADADRKAALEFYRLQEDFRESQTYSAVRNEISPTEYEKHLRKILEQSSIASGTWLDRNQDFQDWLNTRDKSRRRIWLHGIPGSGKTFIVANMVKQMKQARQIILFIFLSHNNQDDGDCVKVLQSLLFQIFDHDPTLRSKIVDGSREYVKDFKNDREFLFNQLCDLLRHIGPNFLVIDGLDELEELPRTTLLGTVLQIIKECRETHVSISSREERDISLGLGPDFVPIRIGAENSNDIESFVTLEARKIVDELRRNGANENASLRARSALQSIAVKSQGMFLYAKLVLGIVKELGTPEEMELEVDILPYGLDQAYRRLLLRVEQKVSPSLRAVPRAILQWVACAQRPLREEEMLQILVVQSGTRDFSRGRKTFNDIRKACGPIIEIRDGVIFFVHFSAKEYLLHDQSGKYINLVEAHMTATVVCATYLSFSSLDEVFRSPTSDLQAMTRQIEAGDFVMFDYASMWFLKHIELYLEAQLSPLDARVSTALEYLFSRRLDNGFDPETVKVRLKATLERSSLSTPLKSLISALLCIRTEVQMGLLESQAQTDEINPSTRYDPLRILSARRAVRTGLERAMKNASGDSLKTLAQLYGSKIYYCDQHFCHAYVSGFSYEETRDNHVQIHRRPQRPHKCEAGNCLYADLGFHNANQLRAHERIYHPMSSRAEKSRDVKPAGPHEIPAEYFEMLKDAILLRNSEFAKQLVGNGTAFDHGKMDEVVSLASCVSSPGVLEVLLSGFGWSRFQSARTKRSLERALAAAIEAKNLPNLKILLASGASMSSIIQIHPIVFEHIPEDRHDSPGESYDGFARALRLWDPELMQYITDSWGVEIPEKLNHPEEVFRKPAIMGASLEEARARFNGIRPYLLDPQVMAMGAASAASGGIVNSLKICLEYGSDPNSESYFRADINCALYIAVQLGDQSGAEMVQLLIQSGATPGVNQLMKMSHLTSIKSIEAILHQPWKSIIAPIHQRQRLNFGAAQQKETHGS